MMKRVIVFRADLLHRSETFIKEQVLALKEWSPVLAGYKLVPGGLHIGAIETFILPGAKPIWRRLFLVLCQWFGLPHPPTVRALRRLDAKLVHAHFGTDATDIWPSVREAGLPMLVTLHGYDINTHREWWEAGKGGLRRHNYPRRLLRMAKDPKVHFVAVSQAIRIRAIEYGIPQDKVEVRYIGVNTADFTPGPIPISQREPRILFVGRLVEKKGVQYLIRAFAEVRKKVPDAELHLVGDGPLRQELGGLACSLDVAVHFHGALSHEQIRAQMDLARVFCLPSVTARSGDAEGFGMVLLEAQSCGVPVVTSARGGGLEGTNEGKTGVIFPERDIQRMTDSIVRLLTDHNLCKSISLAAPKFIKEIFNIQTCTSRLEALYNLITEPHPITN